MLNLQIGVTDFTKTKQIMFRKLVSNLPFSPTLVEQIGFYAKRLRREELTRRTGLIFTIFALIVQGFTVFVPTTSANTSHASDLISGGVTSKSQILSYYDDQSHDYKKILTYVGITREELVSATVQTINSRDYGTDNNAWLSWGRVSRFSAEQGEVKHSVDSATTVYSRPLWRADTTDWTTVHGSTYEALVGNSATRGKFAILFMCGNVVTRTIPTPPTPITVCRPGSGVITINSSEKLSTDLPATSTECMPKNATCQSVTVVKIDRTHFKFKASASLTNASISSYTFVIKNTSTNTTAAHKVVSTTSTTAETDSVELRDAGSYSVSVTVSTSAGEKTSPNCESSFIVAPPDKCEVNPDLLKSDPACKPCAENSSLWYKDPECSPVVVQSKSVFNLTQGVDATKVTAVGGDRIEYHLTVTNPGKVSATASFSEQLDDVLEYSSIQDLGGGVFNATDKVLGWSEVKLEPGQSQTHSFVVALPAAIPATARGQSEPTSYDCVMNNTFGNNTQVKVSCEAVKNVEQVVEQLPSTGPTENILFAGCLLAVVSFFWARSRQLGHEIRLVRKEFSSSGV